METLKARLVGFILEIPWNQAMPRLTWWPKSSRKTHGLGFRVSGFIPAEKCVSRLHEVMHGKTPGKIVELGASKLIVKEGFVSTASHTDSSN